MVPHARGVSLGQVPDGEIRERSRLGGLVDELVRERQIAATQLGATDTQALAVRRWHLDTTGGETDLTLELDEVPLSHWIASRTVFARLPLERRLTHTRDAVLGVDPLFGTHLGYTATVVTADGYLAVVRRTAKLLADGLLDSAIGDTALAADCDEYGQLDVRSLIRNAGMRYLGLAPDQLELRVALMAVRVDDSGLWVSGHARTDVDRAGLVAAIVERSAHPDPRRVVFVPWNKDATERARALGAWTSWGLADLASAAAIDFGPELQEWAWLTLP